MASPKKHRKKDTANQYRIQGATDKLTDNMITIAGSDDGNKRMNGTHGIHGITGINVISGNNGIDGIDGSRRITDSNRIILFHITCLHTRSWN